MRGVLKRRETGAADFGRLLARLDPDRMQAWQQYNQLRNRLAMFFEPCFEASDLADEVLDRIARKLETAEIADLTQFAFGIARNVRREFQQSSATSLPMQDEPTSADDDLEHSIVHALDTQKKHECFLLCMRQLAAEDQQLLLDYHPNQLGNVEESRQRLAKNLGLTPGALRNRAARLRTKLERCCNKCYARAFNLSK